MPTVQTTASVADINKITGLQSSAATIDAGMTKLDGIASGATANTGTVTEVMGDSIISVATGTTTPTLTHSTSDGYLHVPATSTTNNGKVLMAGATAGSISWETPTSGVTDHTLLSNIGTNTHAQIDTALTRLANTSGTNTGDQTDITGNAGTVTNGVYTTDIGTTVQAYSANTTIQGNTFNGASQLVKLDATGKLPAIDGSALTGLPSGVTDHTQLTNIGTNTHAQIDTALTRLANTSGTNTGDLVSGTTIKTVNSTSLLGSGDVAVQSTLVSGTNIKTINSTTLLGSGDIQVQAYNANTAYTNANQTFTVAQRGAVNAIAYSASVIPDFNYQNFSCSLTGNITIANPTNITVGQSGNITLTQDATGGRTTAWGTYFKWSGGTAPTYVTTANSKSTFAYSVQSATEIILVPIIDWK